MYEDILGREASEPEKKILDLGLLPTAKFGDEVMIVRDKHKGKIDAVVLFAVPGTPFDPRRKLSWGFRVEGKSVFVEQKELIPISE